MLIPVILASSGLFGLLAGIPLATASHRKKPLRGTIVAHAFHYLAASTAATTPVAALITAITQGLLAAVVTAAGLTGTFYLFTILYAIAERSAYPEHDQAHWTAEDARTTGQ